MILRFGACRAFSATQAVVYLSWCCLRIPRGALYGVLHVFLRAGRPRIPRSIPRSALTSKSGQCFHAPIVFGLDASVHGGLFVKMNSNPPRAQLGSTVDTRSCVGACVFSAETRHFSASVHLDVEAPGAGTPGV